MLILLLNISLVIYLVHQDVGGLLRQLAVELDTYKNEDEPDRNHIAIDTISVKIVRIVRILSLSSHLDNYTSYLDNCASLASILVFPFLFSLHRFKYIDM